jgi:hypothetical protein
MYKPKSRIPAFLEARAPLGAALGGCMRARAGSVRHCASLTRVAPQIVDIAGLVKGASSGEGLGARSQRCGSRCANAHATCERI